MWTRELDEDWGEDGCGAELIPWPAQVVCFAIVAAYWLATLPWRRWQGTALWEWAAIAALLALTEWRLLR